MKRFLLFLLYTTSVLYVVAQCDVTAKIEYVLERQNTPNEVINEDDISEKRFPAPASIRFYGKETGSVNYRAWFIYNQKDMNNPIARYTDQDVNYTFDDAGTYIVKFEVADNVSECEGEDIFTFQVTDSWLDQPNYFSPDNPAGVNTEFRVAYRSLIKFKCSIFNRWGQKLFEFNDPAKGWDGKYKGEYVNTGVYFYVIEAEGSDGIKYKRGGDINVLRSR